MPNYATMTKDDLLAELKIANDKLKEQDVILAQNKTKLDELNAKGEGWLVETPNATYDGSTLGIQFVRGQAFVRKNQVIPQVSVEPMKQTTIDKMGLKPDEVTAIREREKTSQAERAVRQLERDFGYSVTHFDGSEEADKAMERLVSKRAKEYSQALETLEARKKAQEAIMPQFMGQ